jgi:hypothetical protein
MAQTSLSPIGSSSGLLATLEASHALPHSASPRMAGVAGFAMSFALHAALLVAGLVLIQNLPVVSHDTPVLPQPPTEWVPDTNETPQPKDSNAVGPLDDHKRRLGDPTGEISPTQKSDELDRLLNKDIKPTDASPLIATGNQSNLPAGLIGSTDTDVRGTQRGTRDGDRVRFMDDGPGGGRTGGPIAQRVLFLCDGTGTMVGLKFDLLKHELNATIGKFKPSTSFNVMLFADEKADAFDKALVAATPQNKRKLADYLSKASARGATKPLPGLQAAFAQKPEVIFFLSDGAFDNLVSYDEVIKTIDTLNKDRKVRVYTILFGERDEKAEQTLRKIAADHGGVFKMVTTDQLLK